MDRPAARSTLVVDISEAAVVARPEALLRALSRLRTLGWGIALDDIGADSRSLALMSLLHPDGKASTQVDVQLQLPVRSAQRVTQCAARRGRRAGHNRTGG